MQQKSISAFFPQDLSPAAVGMRERMRQAAETNRRIMEEEAARAEQRELEAIAAEQREFEQARQKRAQAREAQRAAEKRKRIKDLEKRLCGYGELIPGKLYLGNAASAENEEWILTAKVTGIVNCTPDIACYFERDHDATSRESEDGGQIITYENSSGECVIEHPHPEYLRIPVYDSVNDSISKYFLKAIDFIEQNITSGGAVLVHCREGKSRSASVCAAYLMKSKRLKLTEALEYISENAWTPSINLTFLKELMQFEVELYPELLGKSSAEEAREDRDSRPEMTELHPGMSEKDLKKLAEQRAAYEKKLARKRAIRENKGKEFFPVPIDPNRKCTGFFSIFAKYIKPSDDLDNEEKVNKINYEEEEKKDIENEVDSKMEEKKDIENEIECKVENNDIEEKNQDPIEIKRENEENKMDDDEKEKDKVVIEEDEFIDVNNEEKKNEEETKDKDKKNIKQETIETIETKYEDKKNAEQETIEIKDEDSKGKKRKLESEQQPEEPKKKRGRKKKVNDKENSKVQSKLESFFM